MKKLVENRNTIAIMIRPVKNESNLLKLNVKKDFKETIDVGDLIYSHKISETQYFYKIEKLIESRQSSLSQYNYMTFEASLIRE